MHYSYLFVREAWIEYEEALSWYAERSLNAAQHFVEEIDITIEKICKHPKGWRNEFEDFYELKVKKYPFSIIYQINDIERQILITALFHHSRNPENKYQR
jgi:plasmid stabilization system protein ParE